MHALRLLRLAQLRGWRGTATDRIADRHEELLLPRWRTHAEKAYRLVRLVLERVRRVGGDVHGRTGARSLHLAPALVTCIGFLDFLSGLNAGKLEGHGLTELKAYIHKFFRRKSDYAHADILYVMFRHKIAHLAYPYLVFDTATKPRDLGPPQRRITWTVGIYRGKKPLELIVLPTSRTLVRSITPWPVSYDARMVVSLTTLRTHIVGSIYGPSGYLSHLRTDGNARGRFARCIKEYAPP